MFLSTSLLVHPHVCVLACPSVCLPEGLPLYLYTCTVSYMYLYSFFCCFFCFCADYVYMELSGSKEPLSICRLESITKVGAGDWTESLCMSDLVLVRVHNDLNKSVQQLLETSRQYLSRNAKHNKLWTCMHQRSRRTFLHSFRRCSAWTRKGHTHDQYDLI